MKKLIVIVALFLAYSVTSFAQLTPFGLEGKIVTNIKLFDEVLYASTKDSGIFRRGINDNDWTCLGLVGKNIRCVYPYYTNTSELTLLAGVYPYFSVGESTAVFKFSNNIWIEADSGIYSWDHINFISGICTESTVPVIFAAGSCVYKYIGDRWNSTIGMAEVTTMEITPAGAILIGGQTAFEEPIIAKSSDQGNTWNFVYQAHLDTSGYLGYAHSFAFPSSDTSTIFAGVWSPSMVVKTTNNFSTWDPVLQIPYECSFRALAADPYNPAHLFAGTASYDTCVLFETTGGGSAWQAVLLPETISGILDIEIGFSDSLDVYIATDESGVFRLRQYVPVYHIMVNRGWNMISLPNYLPDYHRNSIFPDAASPAYYYEGRYLTTETMQNGKGYWLKFNTPQVVPLVGGYLMPDIMEVNTGWNLVGSFSVPIQTSDLLTDPPGMETSQFYGYKGAYETSDTIKPGDAYWVKATQKGSLILASLSGASAVNKIRIVATAELPPPSPSGESPNPKTHTPNHFALEQNYPNPFNPATVIRYSLSVNSYVSLKIYNMLGAEAATLIDGMQEAGYKSVTFDARNLPSGIYYYKLTAQSFSAVREMLLIK